MHEIDRMLSCGRASSAFVSTSDGIMQIDAKCVVWHAIAATPIPYHAISRLDANRRNNFVIDAELVYSNDLMIDENSICVVRQQAKEEPLAWLCCVSVIDPIGHRGHALSGNFFVPIQFHLCQTIACAIHTRDVLDKVPVHARSPLSDVLLPSRHCLYDVHEFCSVADHATLSDVELVFATLLVSGAPQPSRPGSPPRPIRDIDCASPRPKEHAQKRQKRAVFPLYDLPEELQQAILGHAFDDARGDAGAISNLLLVDNAFAKAIDELASHVFWTVSKCVQTIVNVDLRHEDVLGVFGRLGAAESGRVEASQTLREITIDHNMDVFSFFAATHARTRTGCVAFYASVLTTALHMGKRINIYV